MRHKWTSAESNRTFKRVDEQLTKRGVHGKKSVDRKRSRFYTDDTKELQFSSDPRAWFRTGWTRGHLAASGSHRGSQKKNQRTFTMSNMLPQCYSQNAGEWYRLELISRELTKWYKQVRVVSGGLALPLHYSTFATDGMALMRNEEISLGDWRAGVMFDRVRTWIEDPKKEPAFARDKVSRVSMFRLADGSFVPSHFYKHIHCEKRRWWPLLSSSRGRNTMLKLNKGFIPPAVLSESFLVPNCNIPLPLPLGALSIPTYVLEDLAKEKMLPMRTQLMPVLRRESGGMWSEAVKGQAVCWAKEKKQKWDNLASSLKELNHYPLMKSRLTLKLLRQRSSWHAAVKRCDKMPKLSDIFTICYPTVYSERIRSAHCNAMLENLFHTEGPQAVYDTVQSILGRESPSAEIVEHQDLKLLPLTSFGAKELDKNYYFKNFKPPPPSEEEDTYWRRLRSFSQSALAWLNPVSDTETH